jgi:hypothetical protein
MDHFFENLNTLSKPTRPEETTPPSFFQVFVEKAEAEPLF